jgi:hypothetical protein
MSKKTSIVLISILTAVVLFFAVFAVLPDEIEFGNSASVYHAPIHMIQRGQLLSETTWSTYKIDQGDLSDADLADATAQAQKILANRFSDVYAYHSVPVKVAENGQLRIEVPTTSAYNTTGADEIISSLAVKGLVEVTGAESQEYNKDNVLLSNDGQADLFKKAKTSFYVNGGNKWFIVSVDLTAEGKEAAKSLVESTGNNISGYCFVDGVIAYQVLYSNNTLQFYTGNKVQAKILASFINDGYLAFELSETDFGTTESTNVSAIVGWAFLGLFVAMAIYFVAKYKVIGLSGILSFVIAAAGVIYFSALVFFVNLNIYAIAGFVVGMAVMFYLTDMVFGKIRANLLDGKSMKIAIGRAFAATWKQRLIINVAVLVVGIVLWAIPTAITASLGNALVYSAVVSLVATFGTNHLFAIMTGAIQE